MTESMDGILSGKSPDVAIVVEKLLNAGDTIGLGFVLSPAATRCAAPVVSGLAGPVYAQPPVAGLMWPLDSVNVLVEVPEGVTPSNGPVLSTAVITGFEAMASLIALMLLKTLKTLPVTVLDDSRMLVA